MVYDPLTGIHWLRLAEVAHRCGVTERIVRLWIKAGTLRARRTDGGQYRVNEADLDPILQRKDMR